VRIIDARLQLVFQMCNEKQTMPGQRRILYVHPEKDDNVRNACRSEYKYLQNERKMSIVFTRPYERRERRDIAQIIAQLHTTCRYV